MTYRLLGIVAATLAATASGASAQGVSGTPLGFALPGAFVSSSDLGGEWFQFAHQTYGQQRSGVGGTVVRNLIDERLTSLNLTGGSSISYGIGGGLFGSPAEIYLRYGSSQGSEFSQGINPPIAGNDYIIPLVAPSVGPSNPPTGALLTAGTNPTQAHREEVKSYEGGVGIRWLVRSGSLTFVPGLEFAYQRLSQDQDMRFGFGAGNMYSTVALLDTDYYQFAATLGVSAPIWDKTSLFAVARASLDLVKTDYRGTSLFNFGGALDFASATDTDDSVGGRFSFRGGIAHEPVQNFVVSLSGSVEYRSVLPGVLYPVYTTAGFGAPVNGVTVARIQNTDQTNYGIQAGLTYRFGGAAPVVAKY